MSRAPAEARRSTPNAARRVAGLGVAAAATAPLAVATLLTPAADGHGTHTQMGLPACGWVIAFDQPCPTCGMTTAFTHAAAGDLLASASAQPFGAALAVAAAAVAWGGLHVALTGVRLDRLSSGLLSGRSLWIAGGLALAAWLYKIAVW